MYVCETLFLIAISFYLLNILKKRNYTNKCLSHFPGPSSRFFLGNAPDFLRGKGILDVFVMYWKKYGSIVKIQFTPLRYGLLITDHEFTKEFLLGSTNLSKSKIYDYTKVWLGEGLLTSHEKKWKIQRKILSPAFSHKILIDFLDIFDEQSNILVEKFKQITPAESVDVHNYLSLCSLDIVCETVMGVSVSAQSNEQSDYVKCIKEMCRIIVERSMNIWKHPNFLFMLSSDYRKQNNCLRVIKNFTKQVISSKMERRINKNSDDTDHKTRRRTLLDILLEYSENEKILKREELEDEVHTFMFAGHDTTSATMEFLIYELARNPNVQERTFQEQKLIFGDRMHRETSFNDIKEMKYLDMVIKETLRLYSVVPVISRIISQEFKFKNHVIPAGITLSFLLYGLHRNPDLFPDPDIFNPSRFESSDIMHNFSLIPFSTGPRNCIGQKFAMYEMKVLISKLIRNFEFSPANPEHQLDLRAEIVLTSKTGVKVKITSR